MQNRYWGTTAAITLLFASCVVWTWFNLYQSHYVSGLRILGDTTTRAIIGTPKDGRGDEWSTYVPFLKQAYLEHFPSQSSLEPYKERFDWFISLPRLDASIFFLPNHLAYWLVDGGTALSFQGFYYNALLLFSAFWLLRNLGISATISLSASVILLFSHFYQVWWTSNFPALAASLLPFAVLTSTLRRRYRYPLLFWSVGHMLFGQIYPPFYISLAIGLLPFVVAVKPSVLRRQDILLATVAVTAAMASYAALRWDYILSVTATSYPGQRINTGGGATVALLLSTVFPTLSQPEAPSNIDTIHEFSTVGSVLPLLLLTAVPFIKWDKATVRVTAVFLATLLVVCTYMLAGFPAPLAKITGLSLVPGRRMLLGFSTLVLFYSAYMLSQNSKSISPGSILVSGAISTCVALVIGVRTDIQSAFMGTRSFSYLPVLAAFAGLFVWLIFRKSDQSSERAIAATILIMAAAHVGVYGSFNPIMRASDILQKVDSQVTRDVKAMVSANGGKPIAVIGNYGHLLRGEGLPALNAIHLANVQLEHYVNSLGLTESDAKKYFNQFRGITFDNIRHADASGATVFFPARDRVLLSPHVTGAVDPKKNELVGISVTDVSAVNDGLFSVTWKGHIEKPAPNDGAITISLACEVAESWLARYPIVVGGAPIVDAALQGFAGDLTLRASSVREAHDCASGMLLSIN